MQKFPKLRYSLEIFGPIKGENFKNWRTNPNPKFLRKKRERHVQNKEKGGGKDFFSDYKEAVLEIRR